MRKIFENMMNRYSKKFFKRTRTRNMWQNQNVYYDKRNKNSLKAASLCQRKYFRHYKRVFKISSHISVMTSNTNTYRNGLKNYYYNSVCMYVYVCVCVTLCVSICRKGILQSKMVPHTSLVYRSTMLYGGY